MSLHVTVQHVLEDHVVDAVTLGQVAGGDGGQVCQVLLSLGLVGVLREKTIKIEVTKRGRYSLR